MIRRYMPFEMRGVEPNTYIVNEEFETEDGIPAWIRLKVVNNGKSKFRQIMWFHISAKFQNENH